MKKNSMERTEVLRRYQRQRYREMSEKLLEVVHNLYASSSKVSVRSVARMAGVERITVYRHAEIMDQIRKYR